MEKCPHCGGDLWDYSTEKNAAHKDIVSEWFDAFWQLYPRKVAKASALKAWKKACTSEAIKDTIMLYMKVQLEGWRRTEPQYIPHAATWLNGRRWEDEPVKIGGAYGHIGNERVIACDKCGDSGIEQVFADNGRIPVFRRCSCARGQAPGLLIPQGDEIDPEAFEEDLTAPF